MKGTGKGKRMKRCLALLVINALVLGILPMGNSKVSQAANTLASTENTARAGYGLNNPRTDSDGVTTWDCVWFGNYWQEDTNGDGKADKNDAKQPVKWRVLSVDGDDAFLMADKNLDSQEYNDTWTSVTWENCTMRSWLNGYGAGTNKEGKDYGSNNFLYNAFSSEERSAIQTMDVVNNDNPGYGTEGGNDTLDQVYLLSLDEVMNPAYGFSTDYSKYDESRRAKNTEYAKNQGAYTNTSTEYKGNGYWWLRSRGDDRDFAAYVDDDGYVGRDGDYVSIRDVAVRPALHLNLSSTSSWSYAGTVTSEGGDIGTVTPPQTPSPGVDQGSSGLVCAPDRTVEVGGSVSLNASVFAQTKEEMASLSSTVLWESSDETVATVKNAGFLQSTEATKYKGEGGETSLWWASGLIVVKGKKAGTAVVTGTLADATTVSCQITVTESEASGSSGTEGNAGSLVLGEDKEGSADDGGGVAQFFPSSWSLKSSKYPVQMSQKEDKDGNYTLKVSVGIGRSDILDKDTEWSTYKKACDTANKNSGSRDQLESYRDLFGLESSTVIHSSGWSGEKKPKLSVMGYVECKYDKYVNIISSTGKIAGDLKWSGGISWQFATPLGPMYLKLGAEGKASLKMEPSWDTDKKKLLVDGKLNLVPAISLTGGYGIDKVASISATGKASLDVQAWPPSKATFTAEASVNLYALFIIDYTWTLAKYTSPPLWDTTKVRRYLSAGGETEQNKPEFISTDFTDENNGWLGSGKKALATVDKTDLQKGLLPSSLPMLAQIDGKQVLVWQEYDKSRDMANSVVLMYAVLENGVWSEPKAVCDDGYGDACADLQVIGGKLCLTWQKHKLAQSAGEASDAVAAMGECAEIYYAEFDGESDTFTGITQVTDNTLCDMMPRFVSGSDEVRIAWVRNDANSIMQSEGSNSIYVSGKNGSGFEPEQKLTQAPGTIDRYIGYEKDGETKAVYVTKADGLVAVRNSDNMVEDALADLMLEAEVGTVSAMHYVEGNIHLISNGILYNYDPATGDMTSYEAGNDAFDGTAVYCTNGAKSGYIWSIYDKEDDRGSILASMQTGEGYSNPVTIYETKGEISRCVSPVLTEDGEWNIALNQEESESGAHILSYLCQKERKETSLLSAYVQENDKLGDKTGIEYVFTNTGDTRINEILVQVTLADGSLIRETVRQEVEPGATVAGTAYLDLSEAEKGQEVQIAVCEAGQLPDDGDTVSDQIEQTDIALVGTASEDDGGIQITAYATNRGTRTAKTGIRLFGETEKLNELGSQEGLEIAPGQTGKVSFTVSPDEVKYSDKGTAYLTLYADVEGGDYEPSNNTAYLALYQGEEVYANTEEKEAKNPVTGEEGKPTGSPLPSPTGTPGVTEKPGDDPTAKPDAGVTAKPADSSTAKPSAEPDTRVTAKPADSSTSKPSANPTTPPGTGAPSDPGYLPPTIAPVTQPSTPPDAGKMGTVSSVKLKQKKQTVTVSWKKVPGAAGYQVCYGTSKKWKSKKQKLMRKNKFTVKKLKKKKTYYFRVRAYRVNGTKKVYGAWSKTRKIKIKS